MISVLLSVVGSLSGVCRCVLYLSKKSFVTQQVQGVVMVTVTRLMEGRGENKRIVGHTQLSRMKPEFQMKADFLLSIEEAETRSLGRAGYRG